jgi:hypothetical protein
MISGQRAATPTVTRDSPSTIKKYFLKRKKKIINFSYLEDEQTIERKCCKKRQMN